MVFTNRALPRSSTTTLTASSLSSARLARFVLPHLPWMLTNGRALSTRRCSATLECLPQLNICTGPPRSTAESSPLCRPGESASTATAAPSDLPPFRPPTPAKSDHTVFVCVRAALNSPNTFRVSKPSRVPPNAIVPMRRHANHLSAFSSMPQNFALPPASLPVVSACLTAAQSRIEFDARAVSL